MTNAPPPDDEVVSAYLDAEASPEERVRIESDPGLLARVDELRAVRAWVAEPVRPRAAAQRDAAISAAMGAAGAAGAGAAGAGTAVDEAGVTDLGARRANRRPPRVALAVMGTAAAIALAVAAVAVTRSGNGSSPTAGQASSATFSSDAAGATTIAGGVVTTSAAPVAGPIGGSAATPAAETSQPAGVAPADSRTATASASGDSAGGGIPFLGALADDTALRGALRTVPADAGNAPASPCSVPAARLVATALWQGNPAYVFVGTDGGARVVSENGCGTLAVVPLP